MNVTIHKETADSLWNTLGNFAECKEPVENKDNTLYACNENISITAKFEKNNDGVIVRQDRLKNISNEALSLYTLSSKFSLDGGEYEVYTQYNGWLNESTGSWQPLISTISAHSKSVRNASDAAPFMAIWSRQHNRGVAFHLNADSAWEMKASKTYIDGEEAAFIELEMGVYSDGLSLTLAPGEELELPEIIYYEFFNKTDMDCFKLHNYLNEKYPRRELPVIYNTWLYKFDRFTYEDLIKQIEKAKELGVEYFVIDAGWFGEGSEWWKDRGDWNENQTYGTEGKMLEIAQKVRTCGMKFGLWLEPECAGKFAKICHTHPDYFIEGKRSYFIDFSKKEALDYIFNKTCELIEKYGIEFIKFDFNADLKYDVHHSGFMQYEKGHSDYIKMLKEKYPDLYVENCASGGMRMTVRDGKLYDTFWPTDNQSPYVGLDIFKNSILRMPPQWIESWISILSAQNFSYQYDTPGKGDKIFSTNDATWSNLVSVNMSFLKGFLTGRPIGLSFDLTALSEKDFAELKEFIAKFKADRTFWQNAACHILTDTESMLVLEFRNTDFSRVELLVFTKKANQNNICVYPIVNNKFKYHFSETNTRTAEDLLENGINFPIEQNFVCQFASLMGE